MKPEMDYSDAKWRECLGCSKEFWSEGYFNRLCKRCRERAGKMRSSMEES